MYIDKQLQKALNKITLRIKGNQTCMEQMIAIIRFFKITSELF